MSQLHKQGVLKKTALSLAVIAGLGVSHFATANETSSAMKGFITTPEGAPAAGTKVKIVHVPTGSVKEVMVNEAGLFTAKGLRVGGPYQVVLDSDLFDDATVSDIDLLLGQTYPVNVQLQPRGMERLSVQGRVISAVSGGDGPSMTFTSTDLERRPAINRDLKDIVRADPRVFVDDSESNAIQCAGANPRFNSLTLDGVRMNDNFGLNRNGYPTVRTPFAFAALDQVNVELAPFDVQYGGFTACNFNAVTKSGSNEVEGGVFFDYSSDSLMGDELKGEQYDTGDFDTKRYGFHVGAPLIEDELFIFTAYEKLEGSELFNYNNANEMTDDINRIRQIAADKYGYDIGGMPASMPVEDEKLLVKLDWNITDDHRATLVYNYNDGFELSQSDAWAVTLDSHFYERGAEFNSLVGSVYSDWTDNFSSEIRISHYDLDFRQQSLDGASGFGEFQIRNNGSTIFFGPDDSRQSNDLDYKGTSVSLAGTYYLDEHTLTFGYEYDKLEVFNLFVQHTEGEFRFDSIDDFENGIASRVYYNNAAGTNNPNDIAANFGFAQHTLYAQDQWDLTEHDLSLTFGLRYDHYTSSDKPNYNAAFEERYGFSNQHNLDGIDLLQPRFGFSWQADDQLEVHGGFGLYSGGNPNVWVSNSYSNDGVTQIGLQYRGVDLFNSEMTDGLTPGYGIPQEMFDEIADMEVGAGDGSVNAIDPNFKVPSEWKYALGASYTTLNGYVFAADLLHNRGQDSAIVRDYSIAYSGETAPDGRPMYEKLHDRGWNNDFVLTNVDGGNRSTIFSLYASKEFDYGMSATLGYAYTKSEDINPMTSSVAGSNYSNLATSDALNPSLATSNYEVPHRFTLAWNLNVDMFDGYRTNVSILGQASEGKPYSFTFDDFDSVLGDGNWNGSRQLLYIPTLNDEKVIYGDEFDQAAFEQFIADNGLARGQITSRNGQSADWWVKFDLKISQQIPGFLNDHKGQVYLTIKNVGNLINDDWGMIETGNFVGNGVVEASINDNGQYVYEQFYAQNAELQVSENSLWRINLGVKYNF